MYHFYSRSQEPGKLLARMHSLKRIYLSFQFSYAPCLLNQAKVRKELLEAEAVENKKKKSRLQSESLDHIFVTYFRILKQFHDTPLLPIALAGNVNINC